MAHLPTVLALLLLPSLCCGQMFSGVQDLNRPVHREMGGDCNRPCNGIKKTCRYTFTVTNYFTMGFQCGDCPYNTSHCFNAGCIPAGGYQRSIFCINGQIPGPSIRVCQGDTVIVEVQNMLTTETVTFHWHGLHQRRTPFMDGVPYVSQCPIAPNTKFTYRFLASEAGTHMYHSHMGLQESDGLMGSLTVGVPRREEPNLDVLGFNLIEHEVVLWHWFPRDTSDHEFRKGRFTQQRVLGELILINGHAPSPNTTFVRNGIIYTTPYAVFQVKKGSVCRLRFMLISPLNCAMEVTVEGHEMIVIASDTTNFKPVRVNSIQLHAGERYECVLIRNDNDETQTKFWMKVSGLGICINNRVHQEAIISYDSTTDDLPPGTPTFENSRQPGLILNPISLRSTNYSNYTLIKLTDLESLNTDAENARIARKPDQIIYLEFTQFDVVGGDAPGIRTQINGITYVAPSSPCQTQPEECEYCTAETKAQFCKNDFCACHHVIKIKLGSLVEVVVYEPTLPGAADHPVHFHGTALHVVAMGLLPNNQTLNDLRRMNENGQINKRFDKSPVKDTVSCPNGGFFIGRFIADNAGIWLVHCHIGSHMETGMACGFKVGEDRQMPKVPRNFPKCGNYPPSRSFVWQSALDSLKSSHFN